MEVRPFRYALVVCSALALGAAALPAVAQQAGVGYDPQARGHAISSYQLDNLGTPYHRHAADFTADPGAVGRNPNPYQLDLSDQAVRSAFERRYGPNTAGSRFKRWIGPGNEVKFLVKEALAWHFANDPAALGGSTSGRNGEPTEVEVTDVQAFGDNEIWITYFKEALPGFSPERRLKVCDPDKAPGDSQERDPFWGLQVYYHNTYEAPPAVSPQIPAHVICAEKK